MDRIGVIRVLFAPGENVVVTSPLHKRDAGQRVEVYGIPFDVETVRVAFAVDDEPEAIPQIGTVSEGVMKVSIPDEVLSVEDVRKVKAYFAILDENSTTTVYTVIIPVVDAPAISDIYSEATAEQKSAIDNIILEMQDAAAVASANADEARCSAMRADIAAKDAAETLRKALIDAAAFTPVITAEETAAGVDITITGIDAQGEQSTQEVSIHNGADGQDGQDGVTPDISIGTVSTLQPGSPATASISGTAANPVLNLGIPQGATGAAGQDGQPGQDGAAGADGSDGADGITPTVTVTAITGGHNVAFSYGSGDSRNTDVNVMDGADGRDGTNGTNGINGTDGITPTVAVTAITGGHNVAFSYGNGDSRNTNFNVPDGQNYVLTAQDEQDIAAIVAGMFTNGNTASYGGNS